MSYIVPPWELKKHKIYYVPGRPMSRIYEYTYGYGMNYYQPMIDYLDDESGDADRELPHLPWTNERYIQEYDPKNKVKLYKPEEIKRLKNKYERCAQVNINDFSVKDSYFQAIPTADAVHLNRNFPKNDAIANLKSRDLGKLKSEIETLEMEAYVRYKESMRKLSDENVARFNPGLKNAIRGKSADKIAKYLYANSLVNIRKPQEQTNTDKIEKRMSESKPKDQIENHFPLNEIKNEIHKFSNETEEFLRDTRYRLHLMSQILDEKCPKKDRRC